MSPSSALDQPPALLRLPQLPAIAGPAQTIDDPELAEFHRGRIEGRSTAKNGRGLHPGRSFTHRIFTMARCG